MFGIGGQAVEVIENEATHVLDGHRVVKCVVRGGGKPGGEVARIAAIGAARTFRSAGVDEGVVLGLIIRHVSELAIDDVKCK